MGYQESWVRVEPQRYFGKLVKAYAKAEQEGYYEVAGAEPLSVIILKQSIGGIPEGTKLMWVCGDRCFHTPAGTFGGKLHCNGEVTFYPIEKVLDGPTDRRIDGIDLNAPQMSENDFMTRYSAENYAYRCRNGMAR